MQPAEWEVHVTVNEDSFAVSGGQYSIGTAAFRLEIAVLFPRRESQACPQAHAAAQ